MFQSIQRRASRLGTTTSKFILTIDLQSLELYHDEYLYPPDALVSITLERGAKFSSSSEKEIMLKDEEVNPLNKRMSSARKSFAEPPAPHIPSTVSKISWNERLELVATLYKDANNQRFQEKDAVLKLKAIRRSDVIKGLDKYQTVGKHDIHLHEILNKLLATDPQLSAVYDDDVAIVFQNFKKTSLHFHLRITPLNLNSHPSFSNPFNQFIYSANNTSLLDSPEPAVRGGAEEAIADNASVSSYLSHDDSESDVGFDYADLRETRPMSVHVSVSTPSHLVETLRRSSSVMATPQAQPPPRDSGSTAQLQSTADDVARDHFYSTYGVKEAATKLGRSRSMIAVGPRDSFHSNASAIPVTPKTLSGLFPTATTSEDDISVSLPPPPLSRSPKGRKKKEVTSPWVSAVFRALTQKLQQKEHHIQRLESEIHVINQTNYIEKLELMQRLESLQREMTSVQLQTAASPVAVPDKRGKESKRKNKKSKKAVTSFFPSGKVETIAEVQDEGEAKHTVSALAKTIQKTEETIESFKRSIDSNIQTIQQVAMMRESLTSLSEEAVSKTTDVSTEKLSPAEKEEEARTSPSLDEEDSSSTVTSRQRTSSLTKKYVAAEKYQLLEYELRHCKDVIQALERGRADDQLLIRDVADRVTDNCLKRATSEWELEKARNQLIGYKAMSEQFKQEYSTLQQKYLVLKKKMKKSRQHMTNMEVQFEYRNSLQDVRQMSDALSSSPNRSSFMVPPHLPATSLTSEALLKKPATHDTKQEISL
eukprot:gene12136-13269_t